MRSRLMCSQLMRSQLLNFAVITTSLGLLCGAAVFAQDKPPQPAKEKAAPDANAFQVLPFDKTLKNYNVTIPKILRGDDKWSIDEHKEDFDKFFVNYVFAEMTLPENVEQQPKLREQFYLRQLWTIKDPKAFLHLNELTLDTMKRLVAGKYHPTVRYNAVLIIGDLDSTPRVRVGKETPPTPWPKALDTLLVCATHKSLPDYIKAGAMIGLRRHAEAGIALNTREGIRTPLVAIIQDSKPPAGRDQEVHDWMRSRACEIVGLMQQAGGGNQVPQALTKVMEDPKAALSLRCAAAEALGRLKYDSAFGLDAKAMTTGMGQLALQVSNTTKTSLPTWGDASARRFSAYQLARISTGLKGPATFAKGDVAPLNKDVAARVDSGVTALRDSAGNVNAALTKLTQELSEKLGVTVVPDKTAGKAGTKTKIKEKAAEEPAEKPSFGDDDF